MKCLNEVFLSKKHIFRFIICFAIVNFFLFFILGLKYLSNILSSDTLFATSMYAYTSVFGKTLVILIVLASYLGHFALLAFLPCIMLLPLIFVLPRFLILTLAILIWTAEVIYLIADNIVFLYFHFHINSSILHVIFNRDYPITKFLELSQFEVILMIGMMVLVLLIEVSLTLLIWKKIIVKEKWFFGKKLMISLTACLCTSYVAFILTVTMHNNVFALQTPMLPLYNNILAAILPIKDSFSVISRLSETRFAQPSLPVSQLQYPLQALQCVPKQDKKNIIIIAIDTLRFDALNKKLMPHLLAFADQSWQFNKHYSGGNSTQAGLFSLFYGLPANYWESMRQQKRGAIFIDELIKQGYQTKVYFSSEMTPPFHKTIFYNIPNIRTQPASGNTIPDHDRAITLEFQAFLKQRDKQRPFFSFLFYDAAHGYYTTQNIPKIYPTSDHNLQRLLIVRSTSEMQEVINRYKNAVAFIDTEIEKILASLTAEDLLKDTIVIITSDHGEEFNDNHKSYLGHASNYSHYQIQTPFIVWWPGHKPQVFNHQTSHYDFVPTLMPEILGCINSTKDYSIGKNLLEIKNIPYLLVSSYTNMGIVEKSKITTLYTSGNIQMTDDQMNPLPESEMDEKILTQALAEMRLYYKK